MTRALTVPTIGIGAGADTDGQVLVWHDMLGYYEGHAPRFVKRYADLGEVITEALEPLRRGGAQRRLPGGAAHVRDARGGADRVRGRAEAARVVTWETPRLDGCAALVTGATRGVGRGVALVLGEAGATVYASGRTTVDEVAEGVTARGGRGVPARTDHSDDAQVEALFERIEREAGRLDLVVGNAWGGYAGHDWRTFGAPLWGQSLSRWQAMFESGLRSQLTTARFAAGRMVEQGSGLIVFTGGWDDPGEYLGNLYYDVSKAASRGSSPGSGTSYAIEASRSSGVCRASRAPKPSSTPSPPRGWIRRRRPTRRSTSAARSSRSPPTRRPGR